MRMYDISVPISESTPVYAGDPGVEITAAHAIEDGAGANVSFLRFGAHTATHVDAPAHFIEGAGKVDQLPLDVLIGAARVFEMPADVLEIELSHVENLDFDGAERVLFKTRNSEFWSEAGAEFRKDFTAVAPDAARFLVERGVKLVGIDYLSVEKFGAERAETHLILLENNVVIIEGLDLRAVAAGDYELICLPLKIAGGAGDGAPARAILRQT